MTNEKLLDVPVKILVATHKPYSFPSNSMYVPIRVGCALHPAGDRILCDNSGQHLSEKNAAYCELTALYWAWKNRFFDGSTYAGMVHYRRYFAGDLAFGDSKILSEENITSVLQTYDIIVPNKRRYYVETVYSHYANAHYKKDLDAMREVVYKLAPDFRGAFDTVMNRRSLYLYNMFVMKTDRFYSYCEWLFPLLFEAEKIIDIAAYDSYQRRVFGFLSERLFNVWLLKNGYKVYEVKVANLEGENLLRKGMSMLIRKYFA